MCDPNTGEPIEALGCGPCDTKYHEHFPEQVNNCENEIAPVILQRSNLTGLSFERVFKGSVGPSACNDIEKIGGN